MTPILAFEGIYTPVVTPYDDDGHVVWDALEKVIDHLVDSGVHGLISGGSTGENYTQTVEERLDLARFTQVKLAGRLPLIVGTRCWWRPRPTRSRRNAKMRSMS